MDREREIRMKNNHLRTGTAKIAAAAIAATLAISPVAQAAPATPVKELVLYGIDADSHELVRYAFKTDTYSVIGTVVDQDGYAIDHPEAMTYIPSGPNKGFYAAPMGKDGTGGPKNVLARIDGLTAEAYMYPTPQFTYKGIRGMTTVWDPIAMDWVMLAIAHNNKDAKLVRLDPATGEQFLVMDLDDAWGDPAFEGLSRHVDPDKLYVMTGWKLGLLDLSTGVITDVADHSAYARTESLEIAFGDGGAQIAVPGIPADWTKDGALFGFSDSSNDMLIYNPAGGFTVYTPCSFASLDCEGLVFMTQSQDPFGTITVSPCD